jgi:predicted permease
MIPFQLFKSIYTADFSASYDSRLLIFSIAALILSGVISTLFAMGYTKNGAVRGALAQSMFRGNIILVGASLITSMYGDEGLAALSIVAAFLVPLLNILCVILLSVFDPAEKGLDVKSIFINIVKNPLVVAALLGLFVNFTGIDFPVFLDKTISNIAGIATTFALILLGGSFAFSDMKGRVKDVFLSVFGKLIFFPILCMTAAYFLGMRGVNYSVVMCIFSAPTTVSGYTMAKMMNSDSELAALSVVFTTLFSVFTLFIFVYISKALGII